MKTITVQEIGESWPDLEKTLAEEGEIIIASEDGPFARMLPISLRFAKSLAHPRTRFNAAKHMEWLREISKDEPPRPSTDELLRRDRDDDFPAPRP